MELSCWHGKQYEGTKLLCNCRQVGVHAFLVQAEDLYTVVNHSGSSAWRQIVINGDVIEWAGKKSELCSYLHSMHLGSVLPTKLDPQFDPWAGGPILTPISMTPAEYEIAQKRTRSQAGLGSQAGSACDSGDVVMEGGGIGTYSGGGVTLATGPQALGAEQGTVSSAKARPRLPQAMAASPTP